MNYFIYESGFSGNLSRNAYSKARADVSHILEESGWESISLVEANGIARGIGPLATIAAHLECLHVWEQAVAHLGYGDVLFVQIPAVAHSVFLGRLFRRLEAQGVRIAFFLHDLESFRMTRADVASLRRRLRHRLEERSYFSVDAAYIVHNERMAKCLLEIKRIAEDQIVELGIFDYICDAPKNRELKDWRLVCIAGNLDPAKAGYLGNFPESVGCHLYGLGYQDGSVAHAVYHGAFSPEELLGKLEGGFGLVWDGTSADTCAGSYGEYLRINNPHKTSLFLACGMPVFIWEDAALAPFVQENGCGIAIKSLFEIGTILDRMSFDEYAALAANAQRVGKDLRAGVYTRNAVNAVLESFRGRHA